MTDFTAEVDDKLSSQLGFEGSGGLLGNMGTFLIVGIGLVLAIGVLIGLKMLSNKYPKVKNLKTSLENKLMYNSILRFLI